MRSTSNTASSSDQQAKRTDSPEAKAGQAPVSSWVGVRLRGLQFLAAVPLIGLVVGNLCWTTMNIFWFSLKRNLLLLLAVSNLSAGVFAAEGADATTFTEEDARRIQAIWDHQLTDEIKTGDFVFQFKVVGPKWVKPLTTEEVFSAIEQFDINDELALEQLIKSVSTEDLPGKPGGVEVRLIVDGDRIYEQDAYLYQAVNHGEVVRATRNNKHAYIDIYNPGESPYFINRLEDLRIPPPKKFYEPFTKKTIEVTHKKDDQFELLSSSNDGAVQVGYSFSKGTGTVYERMIATPNKTQWRIARFHEKAQAGTEEISFPRFNLDFDFKNGELLRLHARVLKSIRLNTEIPDDQFELHVEEDDVVVDSRSSREDPFVFRSEAADSAVDARPRRAPLPSNPVPVSTEKPNNTLSFILLANLGFIVIIFFVFFLRRRRSGTGNES